MNPQEYLEFIGKVTDLFGPLLATVIIIFLIVIVGLVVYFHQRMSSIAGLISDKALEKFKKDLDFFSRNEAIRIEFRNGINQRIVDKNIFMHQKLFDLYFLFQESWGFKKETTDEEWRRISIPLDKFRQEIFKESILLGDNSKNMLLCTINMMNTMDTKKAELIGYRTEDPEYGSPRYSQTAAKFLDASESWIRDNIILSYDLKSLELSSSLDAIFKEAKTENEKKILGAQ